MPLRFIEPVEARNTTGKAHNRLPENAREMAEIVLLSRGRKMSGKCYLAGSDLLPQ